MWLNILRDRINYLSTLNFSRLWNAFLLYYSYFSSKITKKNKHRGHPISISIEPTTSCNLRCPQCPSGLRSFTRPTGMIGLELNKNIINQLKKSLTYITYYFQGEPYLNPVFFEMVTYASSQNIYTATSTNAHYLSIENCEKTIKSGLKRLVISIDGTTQDTFSKYRVGGKLSKVIEGTKNLVVTKRKMKSGPLIIWQFIVFKHNEHQIEEIKKLAKKIGVDKLEIKTAQIYDFLSTDNLIPENQKYARYKKKNDGYVIKNKLLNQCWRMWQGCVITWDGDVVPCCFDKDAKHKLGTLQKNNFNKIWDNDAYTNFRNSILKSRKNIDICTNCTEGTKVFDSQF